jgi:hypothetical protein
MTYTLLLTRPVGQEYTTDILLMLDDKVLRREDWKVVSKVCFQISKTVKPIKYNLLPPTTMFCIPQVFSQANISDRKQT